jgi:hypothetical protein
MTRSLILTATCSCGGVELQAFGSPIGSNVCYCDDCQKGADQIEALPDAGAVRGPDGGTAYILYRKDRIECTKGAELLRSYKLKEGPHWVSAYRARFDGDLPPLQRRICTKFKPDGVVLPDDLPSYRGYPPGFLLKLLASRVAMLLGR